MHIDSKQPGTNPFRGVMDVKDGFGEYGRLANRYLNHDDYIKLRANRDFTAAIRALHNADEAMLEAAALVKKDGNRFYVGKTGTPRNYDNLDATESAFFAHLSTARVELAESLARFSKVAETNPHIHNNLVAWTESNISSFDTNLREIDVNALVRVEQLIANISPQSPGTASDSTEPDYAAAAAVLKKKFPDHQPDYYVEAAKGAINAALGIEGLKP